MKIKEVNMEHILFDNGSKITLTTNRIVVKQITQTLSSLKIWR